MIGSTVNPALGRIDYSPIVQGAQSAAQSIQNAGQAAGQMYSNLGKQISGGFEQYQKNKEERDFFVTTVTNRIGQIEKAYDEFKLKPDLYGKEFPVKEDFFKNLKVGDIPNMSIGKLKSLANEYDGILQDTRGALAKANAIRQAERDIKSIAENKFFTDAYSAAQKLTVPTGVSATIKTTYQAPTLQEKIDNLSSLRYGKAAKEGGVISGGKFDRPNYNSVPENIKQFIGVNNYTGAAKLNDETVDRFNQQYDSQVSKVKSFEEFLKTETTPVYNMTGTYGPQVVGSKPLNEAGRTATNNLYADAKSQLATLAQTKKSIDEARAFVERDAKGATPAEIKTYISKDPNLTPLQFASFEFVTKPEFRDATAQEKTDKVLNEYVKKGGELSPEFLAKVKSAFKTDLEKTDLGGGKVAVTYGNSLVVVDINKKERVSLGEIKKFEQDDYQALLNKAARTYPSWDKVPDQFKELIASLTALYGGKDASGMTMSPDVAFNNRFAVLRGTLAPTPQTPMLSPPSGFTPTQTRR
jgi:hypothetical protein